jgi:hypothetical protein
MRRALLVVAWVAFALDAAAWLFFLAWSLVASSREGERAYALEAFIGAGLFLAIGGTGLILASRRKSSLGVGCAGAILAVPCAVALAWWISDMFGL